VNMMIRKFFAALGLGVASVSGAVANPPYSPYSTEATNEIYNLLFCDNWSSFAPQVNQKTLPWQATLFSEPPDIPALETFAADSSQEGRLRAIAYGRLRSAGRKVSTKILLGVIVETPLAKGLDTLAAYSEGGVRYINQSGKMAIFEGVTSLQPLVQNLIRASQTIVDRIGPWDRARLPPPKSGNIRLTFLVSDGLYFGEGPAPQLQRDGSAGQVIQNASALLNQVVALALHSAHRLTHFRVISAGDGGFEATSAS
jgi:hypothetical protein